MSDKPKTVPPKESTPPPLMMIEVPEIKNCLTCAHFSGASFTTGKCLRTGYDADIQRKACDGNNICNSTFSGWESKKPKVELPPQPPPPPEVLVAMETSKQKRYSLMETVITVIIGIIVVTYLSYRGPSNECHHCQTGTVELPGN